MSIQIRYGLLSGIVCGLLYTGLFHYAVGKTLNPLFNQQILFVFLCMFIAILMAIIAKKKQEGTIDFNDAMKTGLAVTVLTGVFISLSFFIYLHWINPAWFREQSILWKSKSINIPSKPSAKNLSVIILSVFNILGAVMTLVFSMVLKDSKNM